VEGRPLPDAAAVLEANVGVARGPVGVGDEVADPGLAAVSGLLGAFQGLLDGRDCLGQPRGLASTAQRFGQFFVNGAVTGIDHARAGGGSAVALHRRVVGGSVG